MYLNYIFFTGKEPLIVDDESDDEDDELEWDEISKAAVPLTISLGIIGMFKDTPDMQQLK